MNRFFFIASIHASSTLLEIARRFPLPLLGALGRFRRFHLPDRQRMPTPRSPLGPRPVVWLHAASLGEAKLLLQFLTILSRRNPDDRYLLTALSKSGLDHLAENAPPSAVAVGFLPLDTLPLMRSLIARFCVSRLWLLETELWPAMLHACRTAGIPVGIANARMEEISFVNYRRFLFVIRPLLEQMDVVLAQNEIYRERFLSLGVRPQAVHVVGNLKSLTTFAPPRREERSALRRALGVRDDEIVLTAGCIHPGEGAVIRRALDLLAARGRRFRCIVVPRHLDKSASITAELGDAVEVLDDCHSESVWSVCLIRKLGILESMYLLSDGAVVGGTFVDVGGHNVWEAAKFLIPVFFGPHRYEQAASCERLLAGGVGFHAADGAALADSLESVLWILQTQFREAARLFAEESNRQQLLQESLIP